VPSYSYDFRKAGKRERNCGEGHLQEEANLCILSKFES